ncbi:MAG: tripartite tricarboxylate transporter substrate binding protein [Akkermansiaceae bacterium]|nr:tripartite tricarboxylate transporter substrate binding protein [Akkermansiaceae bacterium]
MTNRPTRFVARVLATVFTICFAVTAATAADYPTKTVTLVVPFPAGGITDSVARLIAKELAESWKQTVVVDNRPGASGAIGTEAVARASKDGHTALFTITSHIQLPALNPKLRYDALKDFEPVSQVALSSSILAVSPSFPVNSTKDIIAKLKAEPDKHAYGSYGTGTTSNIYGELFKKESGVNMTHVPYKGAAPLVNDLLGGVLNIAFVDTGTAMPHLKAGKIKPLAIIGTQRSAVLPAVPTFDELGLKGFEPYAWMGILMPAGTPEDVVQKMATEVRRIVKDPAMQKRLTESNLEPVASTPAEFAATLRRDGQTWKRVIEAGGVKME